MHFLCPPISIDSKSVLLIEFFKHLCPNLKRKNSSLKNIQHELLSFKNESPIICFKKRNELIHTHSKNIAL